MDREGVEVWLKFYGVKNYTINEDLSVDVEGDINLYSKGLSEISIKFGNVSGDFICEGNHPTKLDSLLLLQ